MTHSLTSTVDVEIIFLYCIIWSNVYYIMFCRNRKAQNDRFPPDKFFSRVVAVSSSTAGMEGWASQLWAFDSKTLKIKLKNFLPEISETQKL